MPPVTLASASAARAFLAARGCRALRVDSRRVRPGDGFIAWPGAAHDGRAYVAQALAAGAAACLVEHEGVAAHAFDDDRIAALPGLKAACGPIASAFHGDPSARLEVVATTGTNGKTSTAWWTAQALGLLGRRCGVVGTLGIGEPPLTASADWTQRVEPTGLTTPDPVTLQAALADWVHQGFAACALEASSIGLVEHRLAGTRLAVALFTNLTRDHLDHHGTMAAYWAAKRSLFDWPGLRAAVVDIDDEQGERLAGELQRAPLELVTVSLHRPARLRARGLRHEAAGLTFEISESGGPALTVRSILAGEYNVHNLLVVAGALRALAVPLAEVAAVLPRLTPVPGRLQPVPGPHGAPAVLVDYAHTPDALDQVLRALRPMAEARGGRLWCVFGCGGNRDATKRPLMGAIAARLADAVVITSDNPRHEPPALILSQILAGADAIGGQGGDAAPAVIEDRAEAIANAVARARAEDVIVIAGKGHERDQEVAGVRRPFADAEVAARALLQREQRGARP